jgi:diguanylate cyclase (GGDEF)-like protein/PAS domain S-box-containing protein
MENRNLDFGESHLVTEQGVSRDMSLHDDVFRKLFETHSDAMAISSAKDRVYYLVNLSFEKLFGYTEEELIGNTPSHFQTWVDTGDREKILYELSEKGYVKNYEGKFRTKDGDIRYGQLSINIIESDGKKFFCTTVHDITDHVLNEEALRESQRQYRELSVTDHLTGLFNSSHFRLVLSSEIDRTKRQLHTQPLSILFMDLDNFKSINDTYGHLVGDTVLKEIALILKDAIRKIDSAYRYGGEEFSVILPATDKRQACIVAEKIRMKIKNHSVLSSSGELIRRTVSIGVSQYRKEESIDDLITRADHRMYLAKHGGRDRVYSTE